MNKKQIMKRCRELRRNSTAAESLLWKNIRNRKINELKFLRQHPIIYDSKNKELRFFIADFYCANKKVIIELDGEIHLNQREYDANRDAIINDLGIQVKRFKNEELNKALSFIKSL